MREKEHPLSFFYNDIVNAENYWNRFGQDDKNLIPYEEKLRSLANVFEQISSQNSVMVLIWDIVKDRFVYGVDKRKVVGHDISLYLAEDGIAFSISNFHPDYLTSLFLMNKESLDFIIKYKGADFNKILINFDGLYKKSNGDYFRYLQQIVCLEYDQKKGPVLFIAFIQDITYLKKDKSANLVITTPDEIKLWNFNFDKQQLEPMQSISVQEKKVLSYLNKGMHSKEIAKELYLSPHTINTHRRNLLRKTNCIDTSGLITYAKLVGLF